jgi:ribonucleoside-diphosphate reductase alpha chain
MNTVMKLEPKDIDAVPFQEASLDIWDKKYRLTAKDGTPIDKSMDDTYKRVARALADVEKEDVRDLWYERFLWALRRGAIPAGRVTSNAGALEHKPATSTINCTVSGIIRDSMDDILQKVHEAGLTLKAGCVAPGTLVRTERGLVTADLAVAERHREILSYDCESGEFEMRPILRHLTTRVPREENIRITSNKTTLTTSVKHPVLVYRGDQLSYVRADEVRVSDALVQYRDRRECDGVNRDGAWFAGVHPGDGSVHEGQDAYRSKRQAFAARAKLLGRRVVFKVRAAERGIVEACGSLFAASRAKMIEATMTQGTAALDYPAASFGASSAAVTGQYDVFQMPKSLRESLQRAAASLTHREKQKMGIYHGHHLQERVSRVWLDRWMARLPALAEQIRFALTLRPVVAIERALPLPEIFFDFTVEKHNNYLAGNNGLAVIHNCGIGYEFSTLRPRGAYVSGAGAYTSGPLSFMDIYDKMCFTVSSAGGRRGAQMGTFDVGHPDVLEFIRAKRENGRLRQFNLSLLVTDGFIQAVRNDADWKLAFPVRRKEHESENFDLDDSTKFLWREWPIHKGYVVNDEGLVACKIYKTLPARRIWDMIMTSTYDFAEPGFILIDRVNEMNNNWWCENIRATNPCVTADTRLATQYGVVRIGDLYDSRVDMQVTVDSRALGESERGVTVRPAVPVFMTAASADVYRVETKDGYEIKATEWHDFYTARGKIKLKDLQLGDELLIQSGKGQFGGCGDGELGLLLGLLTGDGHFTSRGKGQQAAVVDLWGQDRDLAATIVASINALIVGHALKRREYRVSAVAIPERNLLQIRSVLLARVLEQYGFTAKTKLQVPEIVWRGNEACVKAYLRALFQTDGTVNTSGKDLTSCSVRLASSHPSLLKDVQILLANFGVFCRVKKRRDAGRRLLPDGNGGRREYACKADYELIIDGESREYFMAEIGFLTAAKNAKYREWVQGKALQKSQRFTSQISEISYVGREAVFDTTQEDGNTVIFNGLVTGQCGEQALPPYGSCLLGSINLTRFVRHPFSEFSEFDWSEFREVVKVFTRLLDNVVEINGLPLEEQRAEIIRKRRHGMGYLGLGSTITLLGMKYGSPDSIKFTEDVSREMAVAGWEAALELSREKGPAPIMNDEFTVTKEMLRKRPEMTRDGWKAGAKIPGRLLHAKYSRYMQRIAEVAPHLVHELAEVGARFTHHTSIAPTGTISLSLANNASNGIEPSFAHHYFRNVIRDGKKSKEKIDVYSFELLAYRELVNLNAQPRSEEPSEKLPDYFIAADDVAPNAHVDIQAAAQKWVDSSISKTANVPTDFPYEKFKDIYMYAYEQGLKGCTTFRFNPEAFQGVLVKEQDLKNTVYKFTLEDGTVVEARGDEEIDYDGEMHTAANLFDSLKEGYFGRH